MDSRNPKIFRSANSNAQHPFLFPCMVDKRTTFWCKPSQKQCWLSLFLSVNSALLLLLLPPPWLPAYSGDAASKCLWLKRKEFETQSINGRAAGGVEMGRQMSLWDGVFLSPTVFVLSHLFGIAGILYWTRSRRRSRSQEGTVLCAAKWVRVGKGRGVQSFP